ncbi:MAG: hypothetical protein Q4D98_03060 [Planctomycetia bacterium]|nr:hypothetical protein [Planctomycetia bacterium]
MFRPSHPFLSPRYFGVVALLLCGIPFFTWADDFFDSSQWKATDNVVENSFQPMVFNAKDTWYDSHYWTSTGWTRIGKGWFHPDKNQWPTLSFICPKEGDLTVSGTMKKRHVAPQTNGVVGRILHNGRELWKAEIDGGDAVGQSHALSLHVKKGDMLRFIVYPRGDIACDTTGWDPLLAYADGEKYQASDSFSTSLITDSVWRYEAETHIPSVAIAPSELETLRSVLKTSVEQGLEKPVDVELWKGILREWKRDDAFQNAARHLTQTRQLLEDLYPDPALPRARLYYGILANLEKNPDPDPLVHYLRIRVLKRDLALSNPLLDQFQEILFVKSRPSSYNHLVGQYFGWRAQKGGSLFVLENPGKSLACRDVLQGKFNDGSVLEPRLSYDGKKIVFSWVRVTDSPKIPWKQAWYPQETNERETDHREYFHIYEVHTDGTGLKQLTHGNYDDLMPVYLPDGGIAFSSTRRRGYARCFWWGFGSRWNVYTIHRMNGDGSNVQTLSWHDTNEWFPEVGHDGEIFYARWDYIDRDAVTHQNLWKMRPDGTNPMAVWGNATPDIHCVFQARPVPDSRKWLFIASAHHSQTGGPLCLLDPAQGVDGLQAVERITPEIPFPESQSREVPHFYHSPYPLSEKYYLVTYSPHPLVFEPGHGVENGLGIYLFDKFGNRELLYRDPELCASNPIPLLARETPPVLPSFLPEHAPNEGRMFVQDIYQGLGSEVKRGSIKQLRVVQIFPKDTRDADVPPIGVAREENGRAILGTVPVEADGSANFIAPAQTPFLFQALDENGFAYQTMRTLTYLQPGEEIACVGCHEPRSAAVGASSPYFNPTQAGSMPLAARRAPSKLDPGKLGGRPFSYAEMVQPIWNARCISCHGGDPDNADFKKCGIDLTGAPDGAFNRSYVFLTKNASFVPRFPLRNQIQVTEPGGRIGALGSGLIAFLKKGHYDVSLTPEEYATVATWIDLNAIFYGVTDPAQQKIQLQGRPIPMQAMK